MKKMILLFGYLFVSINTFAQVENPIPANGYGNTTWSATGAELPPIQSPVLRADESKDADYSKGVFIVNEDWYGHQNSTINFLTDEGEWMYRVFQKENPGHELGCTSQFGTIYGDKFYIVSKQQQDPGAKIKGSRFAVCDARTMKVIKEHEFIATMTVKGSLGQDSLVSIADGRSYLPVDEHKGYIGTSNGIWLYNTDNMTMGHQIPGTGNPNSGGYGQLYYAQVGTMLRVHDYVFAIHQKEGLMIIDAQADTIIKTLHAPIEKDETEGKNVQRGFGSIVQSKDGNLWISMAKNVLGNGSSLPYILKMNPYTLAVDTIRIPNKDGIEDIPNSWYAWTADGFCASKNENKIYWSGQNGNSWFKGRRIFCYDIDRNIFSKVFDLDTYPGKWILYGTGFRLHPVTDELYCFLFHDFQDPTHVLARINKEGRIIKEHTMITNYWFPALPVFPDNAEPELSVDFPEAVEVSKENPVYKLYLGDKITDRDNMEAAIIKSISKVETNQSFTPVIRNDSLVVTLKNEYKDEKATITLSFNSNGKIITKDIMVKTGLYASGNTNVEASSIRIIPMAETDQISISTDEPFLCQIFSIDGKRVKNSWYTESSYISTTDLSKGIYIIHVETRNETFTLKFLKQ